jgi:tetratricopeptide (TPR) repeat protein
VKAYRFAVCSACFAFLPTLAPSAVLAAPQPAAPGASYEFALGKLLAVEGSVNDALAAFEQAEKLAPEAPETAYVLLEHAQLLDRMSQYSRNTAVRDDSLRKAAEKVAQARKLAPGNLDVLRGVGEIYIDLATSDPAAMTTAREALEEVRKRDPQDAPTFLTLGRIYLDQNQPGKAAEVFRELINNVPQQRMAYALLVESLLRADKPDEAEKALQDILGFDPGALEARLTLADLQSRRGDAKASLETLRAAPEEVRDEPRLRRQTAWALYQLGDLDAALKAAELAPGQEESQGSALMRGLIVAAQGQNEEAAALLRKAREGDPQDPGIALTLAEVLQRSGKRDEATRMLTDLAATLEKGEKAKEAQELRLEAAQMYVDAKEWSKVAGPVAPLLTAQDDAVRLQAVILTADALSRENRADEALQVLAKEKDSPGLAGKRAEVLARAGREAEAEAIFTGLAGQDEAAAMAAAQAYQRLEKFPESIPILEKLAAAHPGQIGPTFMLGSAYERTKQHDKAVAAFRKVLEIQPDFHAALNYLGYTFAESGTNLDEALKLVSRAVALEPDNGAYVDSLGWTYYRLGQPEQARPYLERAARLEPEDATLQEHLGDVYVALGQKERARQAYQRALDLGADDPDKVRRKLDDLKK